MNTVTMIFAMLVVIFASVLHGFLLDDNQNLDHATPSPHDDYHDLVQLLVEEKTLRYRLEGLVDTLSKHVGNLETAFTELARKCDTCSANSSTLQVLSAADLTSLRTDVDLVKHQIMDVNNTRNADFTSLRTDVDLVKHQISDVNNTRNADLTSLRTDVDLVKHQITDFNNTRYAGFYFTATDTTHIAGVFGTAVINIGGAYNRTSGKFVCQRAGVYFFSVTLFGNADRTLCYVRVNQAIYVATAFTNSQNSKYASASSSVFVELSVGDKVSLEDCEGWGSLDHSSSFTGGSIALF